MKLKRWSRPASIAFSLLFIAITCFTLLPIPVQIGPLSFGGAGVASASGEGWLTGYGYRTPIPVNATGTVAGTVHAGIGSRCVLGTGTSFLTWARYDHIQLPDGDWYQIDYISSDTELWLSLPYRGTSVGNHRIMGMDVSDFLLEGANPTQNYFVLEKFVCAEAGTVDRIRVKAGAAVGSAKFAIYNDGDGALGAGQPGSRRCYDNTGYATTASIWNTITPSWTGTTTLVAGTVYWMAFDVSVTGTITALTAIVGNPTDRRYAAATYSTFAAPADANGYGALTTDTANHCIAAWDFDTGSSSYDMRHVNYQLKITVYKGSGSDSAGVIYCGGNCLDDFTDIRFTSSDGETIIPYYKFTYSSGTSAEFWVKLPTVTGAADSFYIYYSNASPVAPPLPPIGYFPNAAAATIDNAAHDVTVENIVYDSVTNKYWWAWAKVNSGGKYQIWLSSSDTISADPADWTNEAAALLANASYHYETPCLVKFGSTWYLYYSKGSAGGDEEIYVQTSTTVNSGYGSETKVLAKGAAGTWDAKFAFEPFVFYDGSQYRMLFAAQSNDGYTWELVGMATCATPDGTFTESSLNPIIRGSSFNTAWNSGRDKSADPWVVKFGSTWYIGYAATNTGHWIAANQWARSGIVTTTDWELFCESGNNNPSLSYGKSGNFDDGAAWRGAMVVDGNGDSLDASKWWLAYGGSNAASGAWVGGLTSISRTRATHDFYPGQVFDFYDGFDGSALNQDVWTIEAGTPAVGSGVLTLTGTNYETIYTKYWPLFSKFLAYGKLDYVATSAYAGNIGLAPGVYGTGSPRTNMWIDAALHLFTVTGTTSTDRGLGYENTNKTWQILWSPNQVVLYADADSWTHTLTLPGTSMPMKLALYNNQSSVVIDWVAMAKVSNPEPVWNTPGGEEFNGDISNTPSSHDFLIVQPSQTYWAGAGEKTLSQLLNDDNAVLYTGFSTKAGGRFNSWPVSTISSMSIYLDKLGSPTGTLYVKVRKVSDNSEVGTLGSKDVATLTTDATWYTFNTPVEVSTAQDIRIMAEYDGGNATNLVHTRIYSDIYAGGNFTYYIEGDGYYTSSTDDFTWGNLTYTSAEPPFPLETSGCWGNLTNNSSFAVDISASMTNMTGGTTWSIGSSPGTNVFTLKIGIAGTANIGNFTTLSNTPVAWIASMAAGNMTRWTMVFYTPTNSPQFADGTPKSGNMTFEAEAS